MSETSMPEFGAAAGIKLFASQRAGRPARDVDPKILAQVTAILTKEGYVQGMKFHEAIKAETDAYNDKRNSKAKTAGKEAPESINLVGMATIKARKEAATMQPYVERAVDTAEEGTKEKPSPLYGKSFALRYTNQGTDDNPKVLWAFVLVNKRERKAKEEAPTATA